MDGAIPRFRECFPRNGFPAVQRWLDDRPAVARLAGVAGSSDSVLAAEIFEATGRTVAIFVDNARRADVLAEECRSLLPEAPVLLFPSRDAVPYNMKSPFGPSVEARFRTLAALLDGSTCIVVAPAAALAQRVPPPRDLFGRIIRLERGRELPMDRLASWLAENGFRKETAASDLGTFSIRGGIFDIYPFMTEYPLRIEYWGDTIESVREFDVFTQKSVRERAQADIFPMKEFCIDDTEVDAGLRRMTGRCDAAGGDRPSVERLRHQWKELGDHDGIEWFLGWFSSAWASLPEYLPEGATVLWDDLLPLELRHAECIDNYRRHLDRAPEHARALATPPDELLVPVSRIRDGLGRLSRVYFDTKDLPADVRTYACDLQEQPAFPPRIESVVDDLLAAHGRGMDALVVSPSVGNAERLRELIGEQCPFVTVCVGLLQKGFVDQQARRLVYAENQLFHRPVHAAPQRRIKSGMPIPNFDALTPGDFVVHVDHGIARFVGIQRISDGAGDRDCMVLQFDDRARLFVPIEDFHKVQKYIGKEGTAPALSRLGTPAWERLKQRTRDALKEMAQELIDLYAKRQFLPGIQFPPDAPWQREFEDAFVFEETPDQLQAIADVKKDMESPRPMDRLVCGDVGFGKTEVAMRAAFKAVMAGYQVAVLTPTTVLAMQHFATFTERMAGFPVRIEVLSRFVNSHDQRHAVQRVQDGSVDILIGTHRVLSADVTFKNLGLLVIDEEQKFGVRHKEKLKHFRSTVDVLALTATPIPRTLHLSLISARDLSVMNTPPRNRLPVETVVAEYHDEMVKNAIEHELDRGGQVYFVHNRVKNLHLIQERVEQMVPRARVASAHGQMHERELERVMTEFVAGRYDVLVSTVIIENGLDIANVNTIIVNRADAMGLSQLYQLRGRVGRSAEQAFAYFLTPPYREVDETSLRRLHALEQYTELGSGFQIAMRDLEIRGAGNILGTRQHGFIAAVGFEMYVRLLKEALGELKGEQPAAELEDVKIEAPVPAFIPVDYISDGAMRVAAYQDLAAVRTTGDLDDLQQSFSDRFGPLPPEVDSLIDLMRIKTLARRLGCARVSIGSDGVLSLGLPDIEPEAVRQRISAIIAGSSRAFEVIGQTPVSMTTSLVADVPGNRIREVLQLLQEIPSDGVALPVPHHVS